MIFYADFYRLKIITDGNLRCLRMRLFSGNSHQFLQDTIQNQIAEKLRLAFVGYRYRAVAFLSLKSASKTGMLNAKVLPEAVGVTMTTFLPFRILFIASA